jgi:hypothetical protein
VLRVTFNYKQIHILHSHSNSVIKTRGVLRGARGFGVKVGAFVWPLYKRTRKKGIIWIKWWLLLLVGVGLQELNPKLWQQ